MENKDIAARIRQARKDKGITFQNLAEEVGLTRSTIQRYASGDISNIKLSVIRDIARCLDVNTDWLLCDSDIKGYYNDELTPVNGRKIPLLGEVACGKPIFASEDREHYVLAGNDIDADFCLKAKGDSMINARITDGDIVFIKQQPVVEPGEIAAVIINNEATLKRVYYYPDKQKLVLQAENPKYEPMVYVNEELNDIIILGKAVCFQSNLQ